MSADPKKPRPKTVKPSGRSRETVQAVTLLGLFILALALTMGLQRLQTVRSTSQSITPEITQQAAAPSATPTTAAPVETVEAIETETDTTTGLILGAILLLLIIIIGTLGVIRHKEN